MPPHSPPIGAHLATMLLLGLALAGCAPCQPSLLGAAAAIERQIALGYELQRLHEPF